MYTSPGNHIGFMELQKNTISQASWTIALVLWISFIVDVVDPENIFIRMLILILFPIAINIYLRKNSKKIKLSRRDNEIIRIMITLFISFMFLLLSFQRLSVKSYSACTQYAGRADSTECVGDYVEVEGPDYAGALLPAFLGAVTFAVGKSMYHDLNKKH